MPERPEVSVVMPCRNEVATVGACVREARAVDLRVEVVEGGDVVAPLD